MNFKTFIILSTKMETKLKTLTIKYSEDNKDTDLSMSQLEQTLQGNIIDKIDFISRFLNYLKEQAINNVDADNLCGECDRFLELKCSICDTNLNSNNCVVHPEAMLCIPCSERIFSKKLIKVSQSDMCKCKN